MMPAPSSARTWRVASSPSITGIRMSIRTTSGRAALAKSDRLGAVGRLPDHLQAGIGIDQDAETRADQRLVVGHEHPDHGWPSPVPAAAA
jgi:hypothetical protein